MLISVIIPTLNEEHYLPETFARLMSHASHMVEVLVIDAGSEDQTVAVAKELGAAVYHVPEFRHLKYKSLNFGIEVAKGDVLVFLDADTALPPHFDQHILAALQQPGIVGGAFDFSFNSSQQPYALLSLANRVRIRIEKLYLGDQALFCTKEVAIQVGGFPDLNLMEAAYFCRALKKAGKIKLLNAQVQTSIRRFEQHGFWRVLWFDIKMWFRFHLGKSVTEYGKEYWSK